MLADGMRLEEMRIIERGASQIKYAPHHPTNQKDNITLFLILGWPEEVTSYNAYRIMYSKTFYYCISVVSITGKHCKRWGGHLFREVLKNIF